MKYIFLLFLIVALSSCSLAPKYHRPSLPIPVTFKEDGQWLYANPAIASLDRGPWWSMYRDSILDELEEKLILCNQDLKAAIARYDEARAALGVAKSNYFPTITGVANVTRLQTSKTVANPLIVRVYNDFLAAANLNYEVDVWGRVRNLVAAARSTARASAADVAFINLSLQAELASDYFALRGADVSQRILDQTVIAYQRALCLTRNRYAVGIVPISDVDLAQNQLDTAKTLAADVHLQRQQFEHAIAVLVGLPPALFSLAPCIEKPVRVDIAPYLPSMLLERRPDVAEAEYMVQAANANIGVARAAFFPAFNLAAAIGFESASLSKLFSRPSLIWSLGPTVASALLNTGSAPEVTQIIFDGGKIYFTSKLAEAQYCETVAKYRQTVLDAYKEVEDGLIAIRQLDCELNTQRSAAAAARRALEQALFRYRGGLTTYLDVVVSENFSLQADLAFTNILTRRQIASVGLIKALGGGWHLCDPVFRK